MQLSSRIFMVTLMGLCLTVVLGSQYLPGLAGRWGLPCCLSQLFYVCESSETQWVWVALLAEELALFKFLQWRSWEREGRHGPTRGGISLGDVSAEAALALFAVLALSAYALHYRTAARSTDCAVLFFGMAIGQGAAAAASTSTGGAAWFRAATLDLLIALLGLASVMHPVTTLPLYYHGQVRWHGPWLVPNTYGLLMGLGVILALGRLGAIARRSSGGLLCGAEPSGHRVARLRATLLGAACVVAAVVMLRGLWRSYSRGAWLGTSVAVIYLGWRCLGHQGIRLWPARWFRVRTSTLIVVLGSALALWTCWGRPVHNPALCRIRSVFNRCDLSWRNRVASYVGALQMMADKPLAGFGWNDNVHAYVGLYSPYEWREENRSAFVLNDYFSVGTSLGVLASVCLVTYILLALTESAAPPSSREAQAPTNSPDAGLAAVPGERLAELRHLKSVCRAGAMVLGIGFWFDRGLFVLGLAAPFWILLELGRGAQPALRLLASDGAQELPEGINNKTGHFGWRSLSLRLASMRGLAVGVLAGLVFVVALFWAGQKDPFRRLWFSVETRGGVTTRCLAIVPKTSPTPLPVVLYLGDSADWTLQVGSELRKIAEMGLATVGAEVGLTNGLDCDAQLQAVTEYLRHRAWADENRIGYVGFGLGAEQLLGFVLRHPEEAPTTLVLRPGGSPGRYATARQAPERGPSLSRAERVFGGAFATKPRQATLMKALTNSKIKSVLLIETVEDGRAAPSVSGGLAAAFRAARIPLAVERADVPASHELDAEMVVLRAVAEHCLACCQGAAALAHFQSIRTWQARTSWPAKAALLALLPACVWALRKGLLRPPSIASGGPRRNMSLGPNAGTEHPGKAASRSAETLPRSATMPWLAAAAVVLCFGAVAVPPAIRLLKVTPMTLALARRDMIATEQVSDFDYLASRPCWAGKRLGTLLDHLELAHYNRRLVNWQVEESVYRDFVLSPEIDAASDGEPTWRWELWRQFYPRIRKEQTPEAAANLLVCLLRATVTIVPTQMARAGASELSRTQVADWAGFQTLYVAAMRSVGIGARLDTAHGAELWAGSQWKPAPKPPVGTWLDAF
jgi:hypothetical protein